MTHSAVHEASLSLPCRANRSGYVIAELGGNWTSCQLPPCAAAPRPAPRRQPPDPGPVRGRACGRQRPCGSGRQQTPGPAARRIPAPGRTITRGSHGPVSYRHGPAPRYLSHGPGRDHRPAEAARSDLPVGDGPGLRPHRRRHRRRGRSASHSTDSSSRVTRSSNISLKEAGMIGERAEHFEGKGTDLSALQSHVEGYLKGNGFTVQTSAPSAQGTVIQARKGGFLAGFVDADRALTIAIQEVPATSRSASASASGSSISRQRRSRPCSSRCCSCPWMWLRPPGT